MTRCLVTLLAWRRIGLVVWCLSFPQISSANELDVQTQYDADKANAPELSALINKTGNNDEIQLVGIHTDYLGSEAAITHYVIAHRAAGTTAWTTVEHATTQSTTQNIDVDIGVTGSRDIKVAAKTTVGVGEYTTPVTVTVT